MADKLEDPNEMLNYSFEKQTELINKLRSDITQVVTSKKRLEMQKAKLEANIATLERQARSSIDSNREDLARLALERKNMFTATGPRFNKTNSRNRKRPIEARRC